MKLEYIVLHRSIGEGKGGAYAAVSPLSCHFHAQSPVMAQCISQILLLCIRDDDNGHIIADFRSAIVLY